jgi:hypothetical protein
MDIDWLSHKEKAQYAAWLRMQGYLPLREERTLEHGSSQGMQFLGKTSKRPTYQVRRPSDWNENQATPFIQNGGIPRHRNSTPSHVIQELGMREMEGTSLEIRRASTCPRPISVMPQIPACAYKGVNCASSSVLKIKDLSTGKKASLASMLHLQGLMSERGGDATDDSICKNPYTENGLIRTVGTRKPGPKSFFIRVTFPQGSRRQ